MTVHALDKGDEMCFAVSISQRLTGSEVKELHMLSTIKLDILKLMAVSLTEQHRLTASVYEYVITTFACTSK